MPDKQPDQTARLEDQYPIIRARAMCSRHSRAVCISPGRQRQWMCNLPGPAAFVPVDKSGGCRRRRKWFPILISSEGARDHRFARVRPERSSSRAACRAGSPKYRRIHTPAGVRPVPWQGLRCRTICSKICRRSSGNNAPVQAGT